MVAFDREAAQQLDTVTAAPVLTFGFVHTHPSPMETVGCTST